MLVEKSYGEAVRLTIMLMFAVYIYIRKMLIAGCTMVHGMVFCSHNAPDWLRCTPTS